MVRIVESGLTTAIKTRLFVTLRVSIVCVKKTLLQLFLELFEVINVFVIRANWFSDKKFRPVHSRLTFMSKIRQASCGLKN